MSIEQLFGRLKETGAKINLVDGEVKLALPKSVSDTLKAELLERKAELKHYLETLFKLKETIPKIIPQYVEQGEVPLSYAQQRLWFINQLNPGSTEYNMQSVLTIQGYLDVDLVEQSFRLITDRHQILRTVYLNSGYNVVQCIQKQHNFALTRHDLTQFSAELQLTRLTELLHADRVLPFALDKDLMLRASMIQLQHQDNGEGAMATAVLALSMHHIASDGWSVQVLLKEFISIYQALIISQPVILPDLTVQYADYAHWQRQWLQGDVLETQLRYWQKQLADLPTVHGLTLSKPRPEEPLRQGAVLRGQLSAEIVEQLTAVARSHQMTAFMLLHAGLALVLARHSNSQDIVLGTPVANRRQLELESLLGFFVNTLVLRVDTGENDLALYLAHVRQVHLDAQSHQDVPFEQLVERLKVPRSNTHTPLFQIMLTMNTDYGLQGDNHDIKLDNLTFTRWPQDVVSTKFDLNIAFVFRNSMLELEWTYDTGLFSEDYIAQLNEHCLRLFTSLSKVPVLHFTTTAELAMLSAQEIHFLQHELNNTSTEHPQGDLMHELFEDQVLVTPEKLALICGAEQYSFAGLNERANQLAHYLRAQGVVAGSLVGIALTRSSLMVVSILAVLKTGAAYVPLDPESPAQRLEYMLEDTGVQFLLTESCLSARFASVSARLLVLDLADLHSYSSENLRFDCGQATDSLMYVIYTSGSTGKPKGVMVPHSAVANLAYSIRSLGLGGATGSWGWIASFAFDASVQGLTQMLLGQTLIVITETQKHDVQQLKQQIQQHQIGVLDCSPALLELWSYQATGDLVAPELGVDLLIGGEAISPSLWRALLCYQQQQGRLAYNVYGPTECTVDSCWAKIIDEAPVIGVMMPNTEGMILSQQRQLVPFGCVGELYIGGAGLARGYLNQQELTAQSFIPHPFSDLNGARLYKTGDLVRYTASGQLAYIGRADEQVKIRGYRIELGEIEQQLSRCEGVSGQLVIARPDASGDKRLVAYLSLTESSLLAEGSTAEVVKAVRTSLQQQLPDYMIPSAFVVLEAWPLTSNGKIDKKALPAADVSQMQAEYEAPKTTTELQLAEIWQQLLGVAQVGRHDNFFALGGHSLLATRLASQIRQQLEVVVSLRDLFSHSELMAQARLIEQAGEGDSIPAIVAVKHEGPLPLSFAQQRLWLLDQIEGGSPHYHMPVVLELRGELDVAVAQQALQQIVERHEVLRTTFDKDAEGEPYQVVHADVQIELRVENVQALEGAGQVSAVRARVASVLGQPFDLSRDLMLRVLLIKVAAQEYVLVANMHHIASDGWSMGVLVKEFSELYRAGVAGVEPELAELTVQYGDYALWQRDYLQGEVLERQLSYWREQLAGLPVLHSLPQDKVRPKQQSFAGGTVESQLDVKQAQKLKQLCQKEGATLFMGLHAVFSALLSRYSNETDIVVGSPVANREQAEVAGLIGFFVNTLVLRSDVSAQAGLVDLIRQSRETCLGAYAHQQVPFEKLVEVLQVERSLSHSPLFQVMLVLQNNEQSELVLPGLTLKPVADEGASAKYDLTLRAVEVDGELMLSWNYNSDLFEVSTIARMAGHFNRLVSEALQAPTQSVHKLALLDAEEVAQLDSWNETAVDYPDALCIHQLFEAQVAKTPDAVALVCGDAQLSYSELNRQANQLAHYLRSEYGVTAETLVGICQQRSIALVVSVLGVLKAGGAYVPLDPSYPAERLGYICTDAGLGVVLCDDDGVAALSAVATVLLDVNRLEVQTQAEDNPQLLGSSRDGAYVIYTSGSTGQPKGVVVEHRGVLNYLTDIKARYFSELSDAVVSTPLSFDATVTSLYGPWLVGGYCLLQAGHELEELAALLMKAEHAMVWKLTPAHLDGLMGCLSVPSTQAHHFVVGGEQLHTATALRWLEQYFPQAQLFNEYGPTETVVGCTVRSDSLLSLALNQAAVPIGYAISNTQLYVLNGQLQRAPLGVSGELYIGGAGVARGYLNRSELTAERFIASPFVAGERLYRTGDVVRYRADGELDYLGRNDFQLKIRGYRIEAGEIEAALQSCGAEVALVTAHRDSQGHQILVGYYQGSELDAVQLREQLSKALPGHLVPTLLIAVDKFVLSANGKIDRKALPAADVSQMQAEYEAPKTTTELQLAEIWQQLLGVAQVGRHDNFFALGGHSLLVIRLKTLIQKKMVIDYPFRELFINDTIAEQANLIDLYLYSTEQHETQEKYLVEEF